MPAAAHTEKDGTFTNTQRLLQWHHKAVEPTGRLPLGAVVHLPPRPHASARSSAGSQRRRKDRPLLDLTWDYPTEGEIAEPSAEAGAARDQRLGRRAASRCRPTPELKADGSTACGCWIYCGCYADGVNQTARRKPGGEQSWVAPEWGWAWPANRRILYNRASADPDGNPWSERKRYVWWDARAGQVDRRGRARLHARHARLTTSRRRAPTGREALRGDEPFIMQADGRGWLFVPSGLVDGPLPTHYEPHESPFANPLYGQQANPARQQFRRGPRTAYNPSDGEPGADVFPYVMTTYRLTEHHTAGGMSRFLPYLSELQPEMFCEVSPELARERGLAHGGWATIVTARTAIEARVLVTDRVAPLKVQGRVVHQVGLPYHWGRRGVSTRRLRERPLPACARPERPHPGGEGGDAATSAPGAGRAGRRCSSWSRTTGAAPASARTGKEVVSGERDVVETPAWPRLRRRGEAADGLLHRHDALHRLQGLRGRVQGVEPRARTTARASPASPTTTAARSAPTAGATSPSSSSASRWA